MYINYHTVFKVLPNIYWDINEIEPTYLETYGITLKNPMLILNL